MAYIVNWITKVVSVPTDDLTLISGTRYSLDMSDFLAEIRRLEWEFSGGLWASTILDHTNTRFDFAGVNYAPFDDLLNDYTVEFTGIATRVDLLGSNNDIIDVLIPTGISVVPSNSAGLQIVQTGGSALTQEEHNQLMGLDTDNLDVLVSTRLATLGYTAPDNQGIIDIEAKVDIIDTLVDELIKLTGYKVTKSGDIITIYESNGSTIWRQYNLANGGRVQV